MEYTFLSIADAAGKLRIGLETMKARLLQKKHLGWVYVKNTIAYSEPNIFLPEWNENFELNRWRDLGFPKYGDYDSRIRKEDAELRHLYEVSGWVVFDAVDEVIANGKTVINNNWIWIPLKDGDGFAIHYLCTSPKTQYSVERFITESDIFIMDSEFSRLSLEPESPIESRPEIMPATLEAAPSTPRKIRSDAEENFIRIIAGLWAQTELSEKPWTAADALVDDLKLMELDKPARDTIANALTQAASLLKGKHPKFR